MLGVATAVEGGGGGAQLLPGLRLVGGPRAAEAGEGHAAVPVSVVPRVPLSRGRARRGRGGGAASRGRGPARCPGPRHRGRAPARARRARGSARPGAGRALARLSAAAVHGRVVAGCAVGAVAGHGRAIVLHHLTSDTQRHAAGRTAGGS